GEIAPQIVTIQPGRIAARHPTGAAVYGSGHADADAGDLTAGDPLQLLDQPPDRADSARVVMARGGDAGARSLLAVGAEYEPFDLGAAVVQSQAHCCFSTFHQYREAPVSPQRLCLRPDRVLDRGSEDRDARAGDRTAVEDRQARHCAPAARAG